MNHMTIKLQPILPAEFDDLFAIVKQAIYPYVEAVFGWDDDFQRRRLVEEHQPEWFYWVYVHAERIGLLCFKPYDNAIHVHLLIVFPDYQNQKLGQLIMSYVHDLAKVEGRERITLSSFVLNTGAIAFYKRLGYQVVEIEDDFLTFELQF